MGQKIVRGIPPSFHISSSIKVDRIPGKGRGIVAVKDIKEGEIIEISPAIPVPDGQAHLISVTVLSDYTFAASDTTDRSCLGLGYTSLYNHSNTPNASFDVNDDAIIILSTDDIKVGEEVTVDYGWYEDEEGYEEEFV